QGERNSDIIPDPNGYVICGSTATTAGADDLLLMKTDTAGNLLWKLAYGVLDSNTMAYSMVKSMDGRYMIAGMTDTYGSGDTDFILIKSDSIFGSANSLCNILLPEIVQDTVTLVASSYSNSSSVNVIASTASFTSVNGIQETPICSQLTFVDKLESHFQFEISPNPFSESINITISTPAQTTGASVVIYDSFGREIKSMGDNLSSRLHRFRFSANDSARLSSGIYYCIVSAGKFRACRKIVFSD
ncbi:MAG: T9SS type A sorting domain-containing protein, partial [Bacteroidia bacterium]|nr:T9SS type A sorting domain-containing protein [Bacteroidia bacterium]